MVTAGFPCQDVSAGNPAGAGLAGSRSGLLTEVFRLIDELKSIKYVCLENSPRILQKGLADVYDLFWSRGYVVSWGVFSAAEVGAPHSRRRWYCLGSKAYMRIHTQYISPSSHWRTESVSRLIRRRAERSRYNKSRLELLGNSVVPQCAFTALLTLAIVSNSRFRASVHSKGITLSEATHPRSERMVICKPDRITTLFYLKSGSQPKPVQLNFTNGSELISRQRWGTPTRSILHLYRKLTKRASKMLVSQIYYEVGTQKKFGYSASQARDADNHWQVNPRWIEWIMGYPKDWTIYDIEAQ